MERDIMWTPWNGKGLEHVHLAQSQELVLMDGLVIGSEGGVPFRLHYEMQCDGQWRVRRAHLRLLSHPFTTLQLVTDGAGSWTTETGETLPELTGCLDIDISATPFTNTLPIRRLSFMPGQSYELNVVYISIPQMLLRNEKQRYTLLERTSGAARYRYEGLATGFSAELSVDADGLALDYPGLFRRVEEGLAQA